MKEWSDKELDKLLQKSAEELDPPYEPADWQQLRRRLDEAEGITPGGGWLKEALPYLAIALLLLLGGLGLYYGTDGETGTSERSSRRAADRPSSQVPPAERAPATPPNRNALELKK